MDKVKASPRSWSLLITMGATIGVAFASALLLATNGFGIVFAATAAIAPVVLALGPTMTRRA